MGKKEMTKRKVNCLTRLGPSHTQGWSLWSEPPTCSPIIWRVSHAPAACKSQGWKISLIRSLTEALPGDLHNDAGPS